MAISGKRFEFLDKELNYLEKDFLAADNSKVLNISKIEEINVSDGANTKEKPDLSTLLGSSTLVKGGKFTKSNASGGRATKGMSTSISTTPVTNIANVPFSDTISPLVNRLPKTTLTTINSTVINNCTFKTAVSQDSRLTSTISKVTDTVTPMAAADRNSQLHGIVTLTTAAATHGVTGVFVNLTNGVNPVVVGKAATLTLKNLANTGNVPVMLDVMRSSNDLGIATQTPNLMNTLVSGLKTSAIRPQDYATTCSTFNNYSASIHKDWLTSDHDDTLSTKNLSSSVNYTDMVQSLVKRNIFTSDRLNEIPSADDVYILAAIQKLSTRQIKK